MPSAYSFHPEFGYFCPSPSLRRKVRFALAIIVLASTVGASQIVVQIANRESNTDDGLAIAAMPLDYSAARSISVGSPPSPAVSAESQSDSAHAALIDATASVVAKPPRQQSIAAHKKPRKAVHNQNRRRDRDRYDAYAWRPQRAAYGSQRSYGHEYARPLH